MVPAVATAGGLPTRLGKYEILTPLAAGGMARIYVARTTGIGSFERHVVLKLITPERANDVTAVQMFLDEARLAASLNHQNVAQVFEVGEDAGIHYLAMEYVHGQDLRALLAKAGGQGSRVPLELALTVVAGAAAGLHHAHERRGPDGISLGIVHRDVSPSNIMIGYDGSVKLLDFGIAKATSRSIETQSGIIKGKFAYMAPEQCRGREVDRRSDVFSLGIILYEISTQHRCFRADSDFDTMHRIVTGDVVRPTRLVQGYPQALEAIVMKALAVDANQRYQSAHQLLEALESFAVSARMSLSTMSLGRFMREMFGEQPEPWLNQNRSHVLPPKESTISSTDGSGSSHAVRRAPTNLPDDSVEPRAESSMQGRTLLDLPRPPNEEPSSDGDDAQVGWNAKSYPPMPPSYASSETLPPQPMTAAPLQLPLQAPAAPVLAVAPLGTQPMPPMGQFASGAGSGSGPAHQALPSTRHSYAGHNDLSYPRYEAPPDDPAVLLRPNRRPLYIGLGIIAIGVAVLLAMTIGNSGQEVKPAADPSGTTAADPTPGVAAATTDPGTSAAAATTADALVIESDESISIRVVSEPAGADVLIAGKPIGTTPLDTKIKKGDGQAILTVHRGGYEDVQTKIDLSGDFEKTLTLKKIGEPPETVPPTDPTDADVNDPKDPAPMIDPPKPDPVVKGPPKKDPPKKDPPKKDPPKKDPMTAKKEPKKDPPKKDPPKEPAKPSCQPPGQVDPFDPRPVCKT